MQATALCCQPCIHAPLGVLLSRPPLYCAPVLPAHGRKTPVFYRRVEGVCCTASARIWLRVTFSVHAFGCVPHQPTENQVSSELRKTCLSHFITLFWITTNLRIFMYPSLIIRHKRSPQYCEFAQRAGFSTRVWSLLLRGDTSCFFHPFAGEIP